MNSKLDKNFSFRENPSRFIRRWLRDSPFLWALSQRHKKKVIKQLKYSTYNYADQGSIKIVTLLLAGFFTIDYLNSQEKTSWSVDRNGLKKQYFSKLWNIFFCIFFFALITYHPIYQSLFYLKLYEDYWVSVSFVIGNKKNSWNAISSRNFSKMLSYKSDIKVLITVSATELWWAMRKPLQ